MCITYLKTECNVLSINVYSLDKDGKTQPLDEIYEKSSYLSMFDDDNVRRISVAERIYQPPFLKPYPNWTPTGSFLPALCALSFFAEKINVYGWDFYLNSSPKNMNYWQLLTNMYKYKLDTGYARSKNHFESALINFYYGHHFSKQPNINIHGYMGQLDTHEKLIKRIERVLFN